MPDVRFIRRLLLDGRPAVCATENFLTARPVPPGIVVFGTGPSRAAALLDVLVVTPCTRTALLSLAFIDAEVIGQPWTLQLTDWDTPQIRKEVNATTGKTGTPRPPSPPSPWCGAIFALTIVIALRFAGLRSRQKL